MPLPVAINGTIALQGPTRQGDTPQPSTKRAMIIRMSEETLEALAAYPARPPLQFEFGDTSVRIPHHTLLYSFRVQLVHFISPHSGYPHRVYILPHERRPRVYPT